MEYLKVLRSYCSAYYILNTAVSALYFVLKTVHPICQWFFKQDDEQCELSWDDSQVLIFAVIVLMIKNTKWKRDSNKDVIGMAFTFFKAVNLVLFFRADWRFFIVYFVICLVFFVALPEPLYKGPDDVQLFSNHVTLENELKENPGVTWLIEFYTVWSPPCKKLAEPFAEVSLKYKNKYLKFGKMDLGKDAVMAKILKIDDSVMSRQLPTLIIFKDGKEAMRRPFSPSVKDGKVTLFHFTKENITNAFELKACFEEAKSKMEREDKRMKREQEKKKEY